MLIDSRSASACPGVRPRATGRRPGYPQKRRLLAGGEGTGLREVHACNGRATPREGMHTMPTFDWYIVRDARAYFGFEITNEGVFLFVSPLQLAMLWPWIKL